MFWSTEEQDGKVTVDLGTLSRRGERSSRPTVHDERSDSELPSKGGEGCGSGPLESFGGVGPGVGSH